MAKKPPNSGKAWTGADNRQLKDLARQNTPTRLIAWNLGRSPAAVATQASEIGQSLKPTNQSPDKRRK